MAAPLAEIQASLSGSEVMVNRVPKRERLMNLVAALLASPAPVPFRDILGRVVGYDDPAAAEALEKRFDRDKAELRKLGIPVEYRPGDGETHGGYVIPREQVFQQRVSFSPEEAMLLSIAGRVGAAATGGGALEEALKSALRKLAVDIPACDPLPDLQSLTLLRSRSGDPRSLENLAVLTHAVTGNRRVRFGYRAVSSGSREQREVDPYGLGLARGSWYLVGHCHLRGTVRVFKVSRIQGSVTALGSEGAPLTFAPPDGFQLEEHLPEAPWNRGSDRPVRVRLRSMTPLAIEGQLPGARVVERQGMETSLELEVRSRAPFVTWVLAQAGRVVVEEPSSMREAVAREAHELAGRYVAAGASVGGGLQAAQGGRP